MQELCILSSKVPVQFRASLPGLLTFVAIPDCVAGSGRIPAPELRLRDQLGARRSLSGFRRKIVVLNFWATWCAPCRTEIPWLKQIHRDYSGRGVSVVGVAVDEDGWRRVSPFLREHDVNYPVLLATPAVLRSYGGLKTLPRTVFIDRQGRIVASHDGIVSEAHFRKVLDLLLAEPAAR
jgi:cytochrome c biogenesis protein CcmG/thiol:disulfide interchange protein DsbE